MKVSFQGEPGAYSESAAYKFFGKEAETIPCETFDDLFSQVSDGTADFGVVPVENSTAGTIVQVYDLLLEHDLRIIGEVKLPVIHCLISFPDTRLENIREIYTHPQAYAQCQNFLRQFPGWEYIPAYDTAGSVKIIQEQNLRDVAAIASSRAAEIYGMKILQMGIESDPYNTTRFFVVYNNLPPEMFFPHANKTSLVFAIPNQSGTLYNCLGEFAGRKINLTKLESRPRPDHPWEYVFYLDLDGSMHDETCTQAIVGLLKRANFVKILGSYQAAK